MRKIGFESFEVDVEKKGRFLKRVNDDYSFRKLSGGLLDAGCTSQMRGSLEPFSSLKGEPMVKCNDGDEENASEIQTG